MSAPNGVRFRVMAPHRGLRCIGNGAAVLLCMGLFLIFCFHPSPTPRFFDVSDNRLSAVMGVDVFDPHVLLCPPHTRG